MNKKIGIIATIIISLLYISPSYAKSNGMSESKAKKLAVAAYIYGYPLVTMDMTRKVMTNYAKAGDSGAPMGQFANAQTYPDASFTAVTTPNADTLYSFAWLDLSKEPYILHVPDEKGRYYLMPILDAWTNVITSIGTRTTGTKEQDYVIVGPNWNGTLPTDVTEIKSPTNLVWILGRTYSSGKSDDLKIVHKIQSKYELIPLSAYDKEGYTPAENKVDPKINMTTSVRDQVNQMDAQTFFNNLALLLKANPPTSADADMVAKLAQLGIVPGQPFDSSKLGDSAVQGLNEAIPAAQKAILKQAKNYGSKKNGWAYTTDVGTYGTDYLQRAYVAYVGLGANLPQDAVYPMTKVDKDGNTLDGSHQYILHFAKGQLPPANAFWSLTMYNDKLFFVNNPLNRYTVSSRSNFIYNGDGSLDIYLQNTQPPENKVNNWLPAPQDNFVLVLRIYWPSNAVLDGDWKFPTITRVDEAPAPTPKTSKASKKSAQKSWAE